MGDTLSRPFSIQLPWPNTTKISPNIPANCPPKPGPVRVPHSPPSSISVLIKPGTRVYTIQCQRLGKPPPNSSPAMSVQFVSPSRIGNIRGPARSGYVHGSWHQYRSRAYPSRKLSPPLTKVWAAAFRILKQKVKFSKALFFDPIRTVLWAIIFH